MTHFASTPAELDTCHRCGMPVLTALDEGLLIRVNLLPLTLAQQIAALAAGKPTYGRLADGQLAYRCATRLPDPRMAQRVHTKHNCRSTT